MAQPEDKMSVRWYDRDNRSLRLICQTVNHYLKVFYDYFCTADCDEVKSGKVRLLAISKLAW